MTRPYAPLFIGLLVIVGLTIPFGFPIASAQSETICGSIVENNFSQNLQEHKYVIALNAGDKITVSAVPLGDTLQLYLQFYDPAGNTLYYMNNAARTPTYTSGVLSAKGNYTIVVANFRAGVGQYTLSIECTLRDGSVIKPGTAPATAPAAASPRPAATASAAGATAAPAAAAPTTTTFAGVGFPGLPPVDFSRVAKLSLASGTPITATLSPGFSDIVGFTVDAKAGDSYELTYTRLSGNLNLGIVILYPKDQVFFQTSLVTSDRLSTRLSLPAAGQYTIGVYRIGLVEPAKPEDTSFQLLGRLNPK